jgi:putative flippase GtrA
MATMSRIARLRATIWTIVRFGLAGGINTVLTGALLSVLARIINPSLAYALVFAAGLVLSTFLAGSFVFRAKMSGRHVIAYVALYAAVFVIGLVVLRTAIRLGMAEGASGLVVLVTAPLTFLGARLLFLRLDAQGHWRSARERRPGWEGTASMGTNRPQTPRADLEDRARRAER